MADQELELSAVIRQLREELLVAVAEGKNEKIKFQIESIDLELKVGVKKSEDVNAGFKFSVLGIGGDLGGIKKWEKEQVQTIKLTLKPVGPDGAPLLPISVKTPGRPPTE